MWQPRNTGTQATKCPSSPFSITTLDFLVNFVISVLHNTIEELQATNGKVKKNRYQIRQHPQDSPILLPGNRLSTGEGVCSCLSLMVEVPDFRAMPRILTGRQRATESEMSYPSVLSPLPGSHPDDL